MKMTINIDGTSNELRRFIEVLDGFEEEAESYKKESPPLNPPKKEKRGFFGKKKNFLEDKRQDPRRIQEDEDPQDQYSRFRPRGRR